MGNPFGSKNATSSGSSSGSSTTTLAPEVKSAYDQLLSQLGSMTNTTGGNATVNQAVSGLGTLANSTNPNYTAATSTLGSAAMPAYNNIPEYLSPYLTGALQTQIAAQNQQNAQQQQQLLGNAIAKGALGGNRIGVAQGELAGQQALANNAANSSLINSAYQQAANAALQGQQNQTAVGNAQAGIGSAETQNTLGSLAQMLSGGQFQQTAPYSNLGTLASIANALSNSGATVTSSGSTTQSVPQGNIFSQLLGAGLGIASLFRDGGRVGYATGGVSGFGDMSTALAAALEASKPVNDNTQSANDNNTPSFGLGSPAFADMQRQGIANIKNWLMPPAGAPNREVAGSPVYAFGGEVRRYADGGFADGFSPYGLTPIIGADVTPSLDSPTPPSPRPMLPPAKPAANPAPNNLGSLYAADEQAYGLPSGYLSTTARIESGGNPNADNGFAHGLFQFTNPTARSVGLGNPYDPIASTDAAARLAAENATKLAQGLGRAPTAGELYLAHQQGAAGALGLLTNPQAPAVSIVGRDAVLNNGGSPDMTAAQFANHWITRFDTGGQLQDVSGIRPGLGVMPSRFVNASFSGQTPDQSNSIGDVINSVQSGKGLGLSDDMRYALLAAGLGMMASKSPFALAGIGEGGLAGLQAYMDRQKMLRENATAQSDIAFKQGELGLAGTDAEQRARQLDIDAARAASDISTQTAGAGLTNVQAAKERYVATPYGMLQYDPTNPNAPPRVVPYSQIMGPSLAGGQAGQEPQPETDKDGFVLNAPQPTAVSPLLMNPDSAKLIYDQTQRALGGAQGDATNAQALNAQLGELANLAKGLPETGFLAQGAGFNQRVDAVKGINSVLSTMGIGPIDPNSVATAEGMKKLATQLQFSVADAVKTDPAAATIAQAAQASPSGENSQQGFNRIVGNIQALNKRSIDRYAFLQDWSNKHFGDTTGADLAFNQANPPEKYIKYGEELTNSLNAPAQVGQSGQSGTAPVGTRANPLVPRQQSDIDNAPVGTVFNINGQMMVK